MPDLHPPLSSIGAHPQHIGYEAARLLDRLLKGAKPPSQPILVPPRPLTTRQSSDIIAMDDADIALALQFIRSHAGKPISVHDILREVPISRRALERRFKKTVGRTPREEIDRVHLERAKMLLEQTDSPILNVALDSGFSNQQIFARSFHRTLGVTPTEYRRKSKIQRTMMHMGS